MIAHVASDGVMVDDETYVVRFDHLAEDTRHDETKTLHIQPQAQEFDSRNLPV